MAVFVSVFVSVFVRLSRQLLAAAAVVGAATVISRAAGANAVTAGFLYLLAVLGIAVWQGFAGGAMGSLLAAACFNFYFFAPIGTFHVADAQNWVALASFLIAATVASRLMARERARAVEAESRRREIEALYHLCVDLFTASATPAGLDVATSRALRTIGAQGGGLLLGDAAAGGRGAAWIGAAPDLEVHRLLANDSPPAMESPTAGGWRNVRLPVFAGGVEVGALIAYGTRADPAALEAVARLVTLALERERLLAERERVGALEQSDQLKTALLQAVSHDLSTPLTAITILLESLKRSLAGNAEGFQIAAQIAEEAGRLQRRIESLLAMARLQAGVFEPRREPTPAADLFRAAREHLRLSAPELRFATSVAPDCPDLDADPSLVVEILVNLIENAQRAAGAGAPIELHAGRHPQDGDRVLLEVLDRGSGLAPGAEAIGPDGASSNAAAGDRGGRRLGLEIARSFAATHGGSVVLLPRPGGGVCARVELPAVLLVAEGAR